MQGLLITKMVTIISKLSIKYVLFDMRKWIVVISTQKEKTVTHNFTFKDFKAKFLIEKLFHSSVIRVVIV